MITEYKNLVSHIDIDRESGSLVYGRFEGIDSPMVAEFMEDIEQNNDRIEMHLVKSTTYKEMLILSLKNLHGADTSMWKELLSEEQKTFGGSKIFYVNRDCSKILIMSVKEEMENKMAMGITRINKVNDKIARLNTNIKRENTTVYEARAKQGEHQKSKDDLINLINKNLRV